MSSPGLQAGDQKAQTALPAIRRPSGGEWREKGGVSVPVPGLKAGAIHQFNIVELNTLIYFSSL